MSTLSWGVKASLVAYVRGTADGSVRLDDGATEGDGVFRFPAAEDGPLRFRGTVTLTGHGGMLHLVFRDPALEPDRDGDGWILSIADPDDPAARLPFARGSALVESAEGLRGEGAVLTADGADLFFGPYTAGTPVDDPIVLP